MKNAIKFLILGMMLVSSFALTSFAQTTPEECAVIYEKYKEERKGPGYEKWRAGMATGNDYLAKCKDVDQTITDYITKDIPKLKKKADDDYIQQTVFIPFNDGIKGKDWAKAFNYAPKVIGELPDEVDVPLLMASIGYDLAVAKTDTYNNDTINYSKMSLQKMEQGKVSGSTDWGAYSWIYKTKDCADGKLNATGWMNYTIGYVMFNRQNQKKNALPYLYKASQSGCETVKNADIVRTIGVWYVEEFTRIEAEKNAKYDELQAEVKKTPVDQPKVDGLKKQYEDLVALQKGYMERVMDAYARAYKIANASTKPSAEYKNALLKRAKEFYGFRYDNNMTGYDAWYSQATAMPFPDPTSAVTPIVETTPSTGTPGTAMSVSNDATAPSTDSRPRTAPTTTGKPATTTTTGATTAPATTTKKAPAKKPAPKQKGTR
jgi:hypothetical protein